MMAGAQDSNGAAMLKDSQSAARLEFCNHLTQNIITGIKSSEHSITLWIESSVHLQQNDVDCLLNQHSRTEQLSDRGRRPSLLLAPLESIRGTSTGFRLSCRRPLILFSLHHRSRRHLRLKRQHRFVPSCADTNGLKFFACRRSRLAATISRR